MIDRERDQAEREVAFDLDGAAHADEPRAKFILQPGVDSFDHGSKIRKSKITSSGSGHADEFHALDFPGPFGLGFMLGAEVAIDDRPMAERLSVAVRVASVRVWVGPHPREGGPWNRSSPSAGATPASHPSFETPLSVEVKGLPESGLNVSRSSP
ncbi:MAG: hypothetical protein WAV18_02280, partial [Roseiarcus sp.]